MCQCWGLRKGLEVRKWQRDACNSTLRSVLKHIMTQWLWICVIIWIFPKTNSKSKWSSVIFVLIGTNIQWALTPIFWDTYFILSSIPAFWQLHIINLLQKTNTIAPFVWTYSIWQGFKNLSLKLIRKPESTNRFAFNFNMKQLRWNIRGWQNVTTSKTRFFLSS